MSGMMCSAAALGGMQLQEEFDLKTAHEAVWDRTGHALQGRLSTHLSRQTPGRF